MFGQDVRAMFIRWLVTISAWLLSSAATWGAGGAVDLAEYGHAMMPIVVGASAEAAVRKYAATLAKQLRRIAGATFKVVEGDGREGIAVGTAADFPALGLTRELAGSGFGAKEGYLLRSHPKGLYVIGASTLAVRHAVWDLLHRVGYRQFFPGPVWEVVPKRRELSLAIDAVEQPDYAYRSIWYGYGTWDYNGEPLSQWRERNRAESAFQLRTGHAYGGIIRRYRSEFEAHPEYLGLVDGKRTSTKFCVSNPGLRKLVVRYAREYFEANPDEQCVSIEPSDGGGWCQCEPCRRLGSPSDRALMLGNEISAWLEKNAPDKYVAMYAYNFHSPPPSIRARPRVIINIATAFLKGGYSVDNLIAGWKAQGVRQFGIREYYSVNTWDRDLPGAARGAQLQYLARTIPQFHAAGARFMNAEASDNWGPNGLGYYIATRIMWDVDEASRVDKLVADFLDKAFGPAQDPMAEFYCLINGPEQPLMSHDLIGRMYRLLDRAWSKADDPAIRARIGHLILYTRYVELFRSYRNAGGADRQAAFEELIRHVYRMRTTMMVHAKALYRDLPARDKQVTVPPECAWNVPEDRNPWKHSRPWSQNELRAIMRAGIEANEIIDFEPVTFSRDLVPVRKLAPPDAKRLPDSSTSRGRHEILTWFEKAPTTLRLKVTGGLIAHYRDRGNVKVELVYLRAAGPHVEQASPLASQPRKTSAVTKLKSCIDRTHVSSHKNTEIVAKAEVPPDGKLREVALTSQHVGLHKLVIEDGMDRTEVIWPEGLPRTIEVSRERSPRHSGRRSGYFYVPPGTSVVGGYGPRDRLAVICNADGKAVFRFSDLDGPDYFQIAVPPDQAGRFWSFRNVPDRLILLTVPPYSARTPAELLLPREVLPPLDRNRR
ncbi:MAG: DUF4838 domain-containing protein [Planctomycetes bacterium]|nr:DUF4838 domain-containing protein [Planctomycetota bacterium]